jgi:hypothetical protein
VTVTSSETRLALLRAYAGAGDDEDRLLRDAGLRRTANEMTGHGSISRWTSPDGDLAIEQWATNDQLACAWFTGGRHVDLAARLVPSLSYLPAAVLHRAARAAPEAAVRSVALRVLGQVHSAADGISRWDGRIQRTLDLAWQDPDPSIRLDAAAVEWDCNPPRARQHIQTALSTDPDDDFRSALTTFRQLAGVPTAAAAPPVASDPAGVDEGRVVLPFQWTGSVTELTALFSNATTAERRDIGWDGETVASVVELTPLGFDAGITFAVPDGGVACAAFTGRQQTATAIGSAHALRYIPVELATVAGVTAADAQTRIMALRALTLASSRRLFPGPPLDPEVARVIAAASSDPDPGVRMAAGTAAIVLREELSAVHELDGEGDG